MRQVVLVLIDKVRPAILLTPPAKAARVTNLTVVPITSTAWGLNTEVPVGPDEGCDHRSVASCDNIVTISKSRVHETIGVFPREDELREAISTALDL